MTRIVRITDPGARSLLCSGILLDLPEWFGRPLATGAYVKVVSKLTTFAWQVGGARAGFAALSRPTDDTFDIHVMGVQRSYHNQGGGRALVAACADHARTQGTTFLTVQTVGASSPDPYYERTRAFYKVCGMRALAEFSHYWGRGTPMLLLGMATGAGME